MTSLFAPFSMIGESFATVMSSGAPKKRTKTKASEAAGKTIKSADKLATEIMNETRGSKQPVVRHHYHHANHCCHFGYTPSFWDVRPIYVIDNGFGAPTPRNRENTGIGVVATIIAAITLYFLTLDCVSSYNAQKRINKLENRMHIIDTKELEGKDQLNKMNALQMDLLKRVRNQYATGTVLKASLLAFSIITAVAAFTGASITLGVIGMTITGAVMLIKLANDSINHEKAMGKIYKEAGKLKAELENTREATGIELESAT